MSHGHKVATLGFTMALALAGVMGLLWLLGGSTPSAHADSPHRVAPDCTGIPAPCHTSIQAAVDAASPDDVIKVATGVYTDVHGRPAPSAYPNPPTSGIITQVVYISKTVTIRGGYTTTNWTTPYPITQPTTLDAQGQGRVILVAGNISPTIEGLRITGGDAAGLGGGGWWGPGDVGGGVHIISATATISNTWVFSNTAYRGGGLFLSSDSATLSNNTVISNIADFGGGLYLGESDATLSGNTVMSNTADEGYGGGLVVVSSDATLSDNTVISNTAKGGGGLIIGYYKTATLINTVVVGNQASTAGSGLYIYGASPRLLHTTIARNRGGDGSGVYVTDDWPRRSPSASRRGGGDGSGVYVTDDGFGTYSNVAMTNTILVSHTVGITVTAGNTATLESTLWHGNTTADWGGAGTIFTGTHNYWGAPLFDADGYHLMDGSAAIDEGVDAGVTTDIDGDSRPQDSAPDLGADEFAPPLGGNELYLPIIMKGY